MAREVIDQQVLVWDGVLLSPTLTGLFKNWFLNPLLLLLLSVGSSVAVIYVRYMTVDMNMGHNKLIKMYEKKMQHYQYLLADKQMKLQGHFLADKTAEMGVHLPKKSQITLVALG